MRRWTCSRKTRARRGVTLVLSWSNTPTSGTRSCSTRTQRSRACRLTSPSRLTSPLRGRTAAAGSDGASAVCSRGQTLRACGTCGFSGAA
uniref:Putative secreted protein n=1 Tax=Ixodes ricinus TaxID=34613 RepID=A0A147BU80_IXORI